MAPELLDGPEKFRTSPTSDVFSLSMIFWNAWTRKLPFSEITSELGAGAAIRKGKRPNRPTTVATTMTATTATTHVEQMDLSPESEQFHLSPESEEINLPPESEESPKSQRIDLSPEWEQIDPPAELERNFLPLEIEQDFWLLLVDMWAHVALSRPSSEDVLERLETMFRFLLEQHD